MKMPAIFFALLMPTLASAFPDGLGAGIALSEYQKQEWHVEDVFRRVMSARSSRRRTGSCSSAPPKVLQALTGSASLHSVRFAFRHEP